MLLNRLTLASTEDLSSTSLYLELAFVTNRNARVDWYKFVPNGFIYQLTLPIGGVTEAESRSVLNLGGRLVELKDRYVLQRGQVNLQAPPRGVEERLSRFEARGIQYNFIERIPGQGAFSISVATLPDAALVLL